MRRPLVYIIFFYILGIVLPYGIISNPYGIKIKGIIFILILLVFLFIFLKMVKKDSAISIEELVRKYYIKPIIIGFILGVAMFLCAYLPLDKTGNLPKERLDIKGKVLWEKVEYVQEEKANFKEGKTIGGKNVEKANFKEETPSPKVEKVTIGVKVSQVLESKISGNAGTHNISNSMDEMAKGKEKAEGPKDIVGKIVQVTIYGGLENYRVLVGSHCNLTGTLERPKGKTNPNSFNYGLFLKTGKVSFLIGIKPNEISIDFTEQKGILEKILSTISKKKIEFIERVYMELGGKKASLLTAVMFGEKANIDEDSLEKFQKNGVIHVLAVSGLHISMIYGFFALFLGKKLGTAGNVMIFIVLIFYGALAAFTPSVVRAIIMISTHIFAKLYWYRYDMLSTTALAALIMLIYNPLDVFSLGFQLSFLAVTLLSVFISHSAWNETKDLIVVSAPIVGLQVCMIPFTAYVFNYVSFVSILSNLPIVFLAGIVLPLGIIGFAVDMGRQNLGGALEDILETAFEVVINIEGAILEMIMRINEIFYVKNISAIEVLSPPIWALIIFYGCVFLIFSEGGKILFTRKKKAITRALFLGIIIFAAGSSVIFTDEYNFHGAVFVDVGQGDSIHIKTPKGKNILVDGGGSPNFDVGEKILMPYLLKNGVKKIDIGIISHLDKDHMDGIVFLAREGIIKKLGVYEGNKLTEKDLLKATNMKKENLFYLKKGDEIRVEKSINISVLYPTQKTDEKYKEESEKVEENSRSLVLDLDFNGERIFLTGDIDTKIEAEIIRERRVSDERGTNKLMGSSEFGKKVEGKMNRVQILKAAHHGSRYSTSSEFLDRLNPRVVVFQVGKNNYGHPSPDVIEKCRKKGIMIYRNDLDGAIIFDKRRGIKTVDGI